MPKPQTYMTEQQIYSIVTAIVFGVVALVHVWRLATGAEFMIGTTAIPMWISWVALIVTGGFAFFGFWLGFEKPKP